MHGKSRDQLRAVAQLVSDVIEKVLAHFMKIERSTGLSEKHRRASAHVSCADKLIDDVYKKRHFQQKAYT